MREFLALLNVNAKSEIFFSGDFCDKEAKRYWLAPTFTITSAYLWPQRVREQKASRPNHASNETKTRQFKTNYLQDFTLCDLFSLLDLTIICASLRDKQKRQL